MKKGVRGGGIGQSFFFIPLLNIFLFANVSQVRGNGPVMGYNRTCLLQRARFAWMKSKLFARCVTGHWVTFGEQKLLLDPRLKFSSVESESFRYY